MNLYVCHCRKGIKRTIRSTKKRQQVSCVLVNVHRLSVHFSMRVRVSVCMGFVFLSWRSEWLLSVTHYSAGHTAPDKSFVAMNTVWELFYGLTDDCVALVSQCCEMELGRRLSGNRYHYHRILLLWCSLITHFCAFSVCHSFISYFTGLNDVN